MGHDNISDAKLAESFKLVDKNNNGVIEWIEFIQMMQSIKTSGEKRKSMTTINGRGAAMSMQGTGGSQSMYLQEEVSTLVRMINNSLKNEEALSDRLPMDPDDDALFDACSDGLVLLYLLNIIDPNMINMKQVHHGQNVFKIRNNLDMMLNASKKVIKVIGIDA